MCGFLDTHYESVWRPSDQSVMNLASLAGTASPRQVTRGLVDTQEAQSTGGDSGVVSPFGISENNSAIHIYKVNIYIYIYMFVYMSIHIDRIYILVFI